MTNTITWIEITVCEECRGCALEGGCGDAGCTDRHGELPFTTVWTDRMAHGYVECFACGETVVDGYVAEIEDKG